MVNKISVYKCFYNFKFTDKSAVTKKTPNSMVFTEHSTPVRIVSAYNDLAAPINYNLILNSIFLLFQN